MDKEFYVDGHYFLDKDEMDRYEREKRIPGKTFIVYYPKKKKWWKFWE